MGGEVIESNLFKGSKTHDLTRPAAKTRIAIAQCYKLCGQMGPNLIMHMEKQVLPVFLVPKHMNIEVN